MTANGAKLTRVRIEGIGPNDHVVRGLLRAFVSSLELGQTEWEEEEPFQLQTTKDGFWGRLTVRRKFDEPQIQTD